MARIRTIKPEFWTDEKIVTLPYVTRLFFIGLWNFSDDHGALPDKPEQLRLLVMPSEKKLDVYQVIDNLIAADLIERYIDEDDDKTFLLIKNWTAHQKIDHPAKSKIIPKEYKKLSIPVSVRRLVAEKYGCKPGKEIFNQCYYCGDEGTIYWHKKHDGSAGFWITFTHELSHFIPEVSSGENNETNIVLCCTNCNRSMGAKRAFEWLFNGKYYTNQKREAIEVFRDNSREFARIREESARIREESLTKGGERKGKDMEGKGEESNSASNLKNEVVIWDIEKYLKEHQAEFETICIAHRKSAEEVKSIMEKFHLWNVSNDKYPKKPLALIAGLKGWILNEKNNTDGTKKSFTGNSKHTGNNQLIERLKAKVAAAGGTDGAGNEVQK